MDLNQSITTNQRHVLRLKDNLIAQIVTNAIEVEKDFVQNRQTWKEIQIKSSLVNSSLVQSKIIFQYWLAIMKKC